MQLISYICTYIYISLKQFCSFLLFKKKKIEKYDKIKKTSVLARLDTTVVHVYSIPSHCLSGCFELCNLLDILMICPLVL